MKTITLRIPYESRSDVFKVVPFGDIHAGTVFCREDKVRAKAKEIKNDPFTYWVGMGDFGEFIPPKDKRFDAQVLSDGDWLKKKDIAASQEEWICDIFSPIKDKCLGLIMGNHEVSIQRDNNHDIFGHLVSRLGVKDLGYSCFYRLMFDRGGSVTTVTFHIEHGSGGAQTEGGKAMRLYKSMCGFEADIYLMGHLHDVKILPISYLSMTLNGEIKEKSKVGCITGCWYATYTDADNPSYAEQKGYSPTNMGCPVIEITPDKREMQAVHKKIF